MRINYDAEADALYVGLKADVGEVLRTRELDPSTLVDLDASGDLVGIEVLHPDREWPVEQAIRNYRIPQEDAAILRSLWGGRSAMQPTHTRAFPPDP